jgi:acetolactate synthase-1/2/3 large subunit
MASAAELLARGLYQAGCRHAFGIPGGEVLTVMHALADAGIGFTLTKHENSAGFMAEGTYHMTGAPGVLVATLGPGVANAVNVVANAQQDRVPLIFLTGCVDPVDSVSYTHQVFDHVKLLEPVTKASFTLIDGAVETIVEKALAEATQGRPGPVLIDVPISLAGKEQAEARPIRPMTLAPAAPAEGPELETARRQFAEARRPLMIAGLDALEENAAEAAAATARRFSVPLVTTYKAKGILPEGDPLAIGAAGLSPLADRHIMPLVAAADFILLVGYDPIEMRHGWKHPWDPTRTPVIEFTAAAELHGMHHTSRTFLGDIAAGLARLTEGTSPRKTWPDGAPDEAKRRLAEAFGAEKDWGPGAAIQAAREALPDHGIATVDSGAHRILLSQIWSCPEPRGLLQSTGLCTMGCALPLAMGVKLADPTRPVIAFTGDAGLEMVLGELATLRDLKLPLVVVVFVDASLALIELKQRQSQRPNLAVDFGATDFAAVARALGGQGVDVSSRDAMVEAVTQGLAAEVFTLVAARIDRAAYDGKF